MKYILTVLLVLTLALPALAGRAPVTNIASDPYVSALLLNGDTGETLFADNENAVVYPASVLKLMVLLVTLDRIDQGMVHLDDMVQVTVEAYKMGGSQVYLDPKEQFSVDEMLYALMVQSANDAAVALATHIAGSKEAFVDLMNQKARELGMTSTTFHSVHGLPPSTGQKVDVTTARDFGKLCLELAKRPEVFKYTGTRVRDFRGGEFIMRNHNHLLEKVDGCDGFKTGYFKAAGFSIAATAKRRGRRVIALVMGSRDRKVRDAKATELLTRGFAMIPAVPEPAVAATTPAVKTPVAAAPESLQQPVAENQAPVAAAGPEKEGSSAALKAGGIGVILLLAFFGLLVWKKRQRKNKFRRRL